MSDSLVLVTFHESSPLRGLLKVSSSGYDAAELSRTKDLLVATSSSLLSELEICFQEEDDYSSSPSTYSRTGRVDHGVGSSIASSSLSSNSDIDDLNNDDGDADDAFDEDDEVDEELMSVFEDDSDQCVDDDYDDDDEGYDTVHQNLAVQLSIFDILNIEPDDDDEEESEPKISANETTSNACESDLNFAFFEDSDSSLENSNNGPFDGYFDQDPDGSMTTSDDLLESTDLFAASGGLFLTSLFRKPSSSSAEPQQLLPSMPEASLPSVPENAQNLDNNNAGDDVEQALELTEESASAILVISSSPNCSLDLPLTSEEIARHFAQMQLANEEGRKAAEAVKEANHKWNLAMADLGEDLATIELAQDNRRRIHFAGTDQVFIVERLDPLDIVCEQMLASFHGFGFGPNMLEDDDDDYKPEEMLFDLDLD